MLVALQIQWLLYEVSLVSRETLIIFLTCSHNPRLDLVVEDCVVPRPHSETACQDALYCSSIEGC